VYSIYLLRDTLWKHMEEFKIPTKLINMCRMCTKDKKCG